MSNKKTPQLKKQASFSSVIGEYESLFPVYQKYTNRLKQLLDQLLIANNIPFHIIEGRAKSVSSFSDKIHRPGKNYNNPLSEIRDLSGLRIILYYTDDVSRVSEIIDRELKVDTDNSIDKADLLEPDQFGYLSIHKVICLDKKRKEMSEWSAYRNLYAEIQIRTVLQHAWASISHRLQYKRESEIPASFRRKLTLLSGLLEIADNEFSELQEEITSAREDISSRIKAKDSALLLNLDSLTEYLKDIKTIKRTISIHAETAGFETTSDSATEHESIPILLQVCLLLNINTTSELTIYLSQLFEKIGEFFNNFKNTYNRQMPGSSIHWLTVWLVGIDRGKSITVDNLPWDYDYIQSIITAGEVTFIK